MHICVVGTGSSGWIAANYLRLLPNIRKVTVVGSSEIPPIGVGESNTLALINFLRKFIDRGEITWESFIRETDAALKYGVYYQNWANCDFLHHFKCSESWNSKFDQEHYGRLLANKNPKTHIHDILGTKTFDGVIENNVFLNTYNFLHSYHFDAGKFISFMSKMALKDSKINYIDSTIVDGKHVDDHVKYIIGKDGRKICADYFIFATGDSKINEKFLGVKYKSLSKYLLTDTAIVYPLEYENKREQFHPYTIAKTMKHGWRWITPTWSRIGTGYVFSSRHVSVDKAVDEFLKDIGNDKISPSVVNFKPRYNPKTFHKNWSTIGMSQGFLEPLDAPGLTLTMEILMTQLSHYISIYETHLKNDEKTMKIELEKLNDLVVNRKFNFWCAFILCQYKTCHRNDTRFWRNHKRVKCDFYDEFINNLDIPNSDVGNFLFQQTMASKGVRWKTSLSSEPYVVNDHMSEKMHHLDYISQYHNK